MSTTVNAPDDRDFLNVGVRAWTGNRKSKSKTDRDSSLPTKLLVLDTETTIDENQTLKFGSAQLIRINNVKDKVRNGDFLDEIMFYDDELPITDPDGFAVLVSYCQSRDLKLISKSDFAEQWIYYYCVRKTGINGRITGTGMLTGFNLPFDMSRLAYAHGNGRRHNKGAFTIQMFPNYKESENPFRPRFICNSLDAKKSLTSWGSIKDGNPSVNNQKMNSGQFLDVRQLIWGMTNRSCIPGNRLRIIRTT